MGELKDKEFEILLTLLRSGLWERAIDDMSLFPISDELWQRVFTLSCDQTVTGLVYRGITYLPDEMMPSFAEKIKWVARIDAIERHNEHTHKVLCSLYQTFTNAGLHPILQKGIGIAQMYECPQLRESGDIDFYFNIYEWKRANGLFNISKRQADGSVTYQFQDIAIEHHKQMFDLCTPFKQHYLQSLLDSTVIRINDGKLDIQVPSPLTNVVLQNTHILKHAIGLGVGLRQLCDLARTYYTLSGGLDGKQVQLTYKQLGLERWSRLLHTLLVNYLGLDAKYLPYELDEEEDATKFFEDVRFGGNFGLHSQQRNLMNGSAWKRKIHTCYRSIRRTGFFLYYAPSEFFWRFGSFVLRQFYR